MKFELVELGLASEETKGKAQSVSCQYPEPGLKVGFRIDANDTAEGTA
jgi:hypothetical protein